MGPRFPAALLYVLGWLVLSALVALTALQIHGLIVVAGNYVIGNPSLRPSGWSSNTIAGVSSMAYVVLGAITLGVVTYLEQALRSASREGEMGRTTLRITLTVVAVWLVVLVIRLAL